MMCCCRWPIKSLGFWVCQPIAAAGFPGCLGWRHCSWASLGSK